MSESGESQPQNDSDEDIYKDFSDFNFGDELAKLEESKETIKKEALDLSEQVKVLTKENEEMKKSNEILKKNMSSLLKTAQAEIQRKDSMIEELRNKVDSFTFRRKNKITKDKYTSTHDLEMTLKIKNGLEESTNFSNKKRSKSKECRSSCDSERKLFNEEQRKKESEEKKESLNCDNNRKYGNYKDCTRRKSRHSSSSREVYNKRESHFRKSTKRNEPDHRGSFNDNHKDHIKYHSLDRRKRSRSSDRRFTYRRRNSPGRRGERQEESPNRRRKEKKEDVEEKGKSKSRERSKNSRESCLNHATLRSSIDKDSGSRNKDPSNRLKETSSVKPENEEEKKVKGFIERQKSKKDEFKGSRRISKEENSSKNEKPSEFDKFSTKSPLDALYNEMITRRSSNRFSKLGLGVTRSETDEEVAKSDQQKPQEEEEEEDWTLSFKNERRETVKPMTLYSKRMMQKISEAKENEKAKEKLQEQDDTRKKVENNESEKEPGELTDDENIIESSKEFQELTKVASIENIEKPKESELFKEPEVVKSKAETESKPEESESCNEAQPQSSDVIEYSPFKNNYKLIEISPIKPPDKEQLMELYHQRTSTGQVQKEVESSIFNLLSSLSGVPLASNNSKIQKRKRSSESEPERKKAKLNESPKKRTRCRNKTGNIEAEPEPGSETKVKEDITTFEFFKPIAKKDTLDTPTECKMTAMSVANIVCLETPNKGVTNLKNLMINEQMILNVLDSKNSALCSPLMTPRRLLKNDLMLTDSEDDSFNKNNVEEEEGEEEMSESENSECESDSGASDFVDLL